MQDPPSKSISSVGVFSQVKKGSRRVMQDAESVKYSEMSSGIRQVIGGLEMRAALPQVWVRYHIAAVEVPRGLQWVCRDDT